jgi:hypothetical protein
MGYIGDRVVICDAYAEPHSTTASLPVALDGESRLG